MLTYLDLFVVVAMTVVAPLLENFDQLVLLEEQPAAQQEQPVVEQPKQLLALVEENSMALIAPLR